MSSPCPSSNGMMSMSASTITISSQSNPQSEKYENTTYGNIKGKRRSWHIMPNKVIYFTVIAMSIHSNSHKN